MALVPSRIAMALVPSRVAMALVPSRVGLALQGRLQSVQVTAKALLLPPSRLSPFMSPSGSPEVILLGFAKDFADYLLITTKVVLEKNISSYTMSMDLVKENPKDPGGYMMSELPLKVPKSFILPWNMSLRFDKRSMFGNTTVRFRSDSCSALKVMRRHLSKTPYGNDDNNQFAPRNWLTPEGLYEIPPGAPWWSRLIMYEGPPPYPRWRLFVLLYVSAKVDYWLTLSPESRTTIKQSLLGNAITYSCASVLWVLKEVVVWLFTSDGPPTDLEARVTLLQEALESKEGHIRLLTQQLEERNAEILMLELIQSPQTIHVLLQFALLFAQLVEPSLVCCLDLAEGFGMGYWRLT